MSEGVRVIVYFLYFLDHHIVHDIRSHLVCTVLGEKSEDKNNREFFIERRDR